MDLEMMTYARVAHDAAPGSMAARPHDSGVDDEIGDVANASAIRSAQADLKRAKFTVIIVYIVVVTATLGLGGTFVLARSDEANAPGTREQTPGAPASASSSAGPFGELPYDATNVLVLTSEVGEKEDSIHQSSGRYLTGTRTKEPVRRAATR